MSDAASGKPRFTGEQQQVIDAVNNSILVSAAAGSGKTTVLVERIFRLIAEENGIDADRLLVVTFTRAAAAQMKERLLRRMHDALRTDPANARLRRQESLLQHAQITTIDAFCHYIIKDNFASLDIDPASRVADDGERRLLEKETLADTLERLYESGDEDFLFCCDYFSAGTSDVRVEEHIEALHRVAQSMPDPVLWLKAFAEDTKKSMPPEEEGYVRFCRDDVRRLLDGCAAQLLSALALCEVPDGPYPYAPRIEEDVKAVQAAADIASSGNFDTVRSAVLSVGFDRLPQVRKNDAVSPALQAAVRTLRDGVKETFADLKTRYFRRGLEDAVKQEEKTARARRALAAAALAYEVDLRDAKREKNLIEFSDMEHLALQVLLMPETKPDGTTLYKPTRIAEEYRARYDAVMIDEYQDSSVLQELLLSAVANKRFMVGDVKQSIYRFRQANPGLFTYKMAHYEKAYDAEKRRIDLHKNFRSRIQILDTVNAVFSRLMESDLGGVAYDEDAALSPGNGDGSPRDGVYGTKDDPYATEVLLCEAPEDRDETEAYAVATRIADLVSGVRKDGSRVRYGDIVILMRATGGRDETYRKVLEEQGIPVYVESRTGYYDVYEIRTMLQLLSVLNNPLQDIPFVSVMHGAVGGFDDVETARIRAWDIRQGARGGFFYEIAERFARGTSMDDADAALAGRVRTFLDMLESFRSRAVYLPVHTLLETVLDETGFADIVSAMPGGARRSANLEVLLSRAKAFEKTSYRGLSRFINYVETMRKFEADEGEANVLGEDADVVRIMTIHKSKGLEFPVVFVTGLSVQFNLRDAQKEFLIDPEFGIACSEIDTERRTKASTLKKNVIAAKLVSESLGEEMRILYVAMTRAVDKLILTGTMKDPDKELPKIAALCATADGTLPYPVRSGARNYMKWILYALGAHPGFAGLLNDIGAEVPESEGEAPAAPVLFTLLRGEDLIAGEARADTDLRVRKQALESDDMRNEAVEDLLQTRFSFRYRHEVLRNLFTKTTVTELKEALLEESETGESETAPKRSRRLFSYTSDTPDLMPSFLQKEEDRIAPLTGAARGMLYHKAMELYWKEAVKLSGDPISEGNPEEGIRSFLNRCEEEALLPVNGAQALDPRVIRTFLESPLASRMMAAAKKKALYAERPFMVGVPACELDDTLPAEELLLVQGIIDCFFEEDGALVILDYKTDHVSQAKELRERYAAQLDYYAKALEQITEKNVKERLIYSFTLQETIVV